LVAALPGAGSLLLPIGACPACWPAYAGFLSSLGLGFLLDGLYLLPLLVMLLAFALGSLAYRARERRGFGPSCLGLLGVVAAVIGKFAIPADPLVYLGVAALVVAAAWNAWPRRRSGSCARCVGQDSGVETGPDAHIVGPS